MPKNLSKNRVDARSIQRALKNKLKGKITAQLRTRFEHGVLVITGNVTTHDALQLVDEIVYDMAPTADVDNRVHVRLPIDISLARHPEESLALDHQFGQEIASGNSM